MNNKTVYDDLLSYKVKTDDVKLITELFIKIQKHDMDITLKDLMHFYNKKINFLRFKKLISVAIEYKIKLPTEKLKNISLSGNDFLNLLAGIISAGKDGLEIKIEDIEYFAKVKINIPDLLFSLKKINKYDNSIILNDFTNCTNCLYKTSEFVDDLIKFKKTDPNISLKKVIKLSFKKDEASSVLNKYTVLRHYSNLFSLSDIIEIKAQGTDVIDFMTALMVAEKHGLKIDKKLLIDISKKKRSLLEVITMSFSPEKNEMKPVRVILNSGLEILLKIKFDLFTKIESYASGSGKEKIKKKITHSLAVAAHKYNSVKDFILDSEHIQKQVEDKVNRLDSAYRINSLSIDDFVIGRDIESEQERKILDSKRKRAIAYNAYKMEIKNPKIKEQHSNNDHHNSHDNHKSDDHHNSDEHH